MDEISLKENLAAVFAAPPTPQSLIERTVVRGREIETGCAVEQRLSQAQEVSREELVGLVAQSVVGRLMRTHLPPNGVDERQMAGDLQKNERFAAAVNGSPAELLGRLKNGRWIAQFAEKQKIQRIPSPATLAKTAPEHKIPQKDPITKGGPSL